MKKNNYGFTKDGNLIFFTFSIFPNLFKLLLLDEKVQMVAISEFGGFFSCYGHFPSKFSPN